NGPLASLMIREAIALTCKKWGVAPFITYVAIGKVRHKRDPGRCFVRAGFKRCGVRQKTKHGPMLRLEMGLFDVVQCYQEVFDLPAPRGMREKRSRQCNHISNE